MKEFLKQLKSQKPQPHESLEQRILRDVKPTIAPKRSFSFGSFCAGTLGGTCIGLLLGLFLFSYGETAKIVETPPNVKAPVEQIIPQSPPLEYDPEPELDLLIAKIDKRNRIWEKATIHDYSVKIRPQLNFEAFMK